MDDQTKERWYQLCQLAAAEQDPQKLLALVTEISSLLEAKERKLRVVRGAQPWNQPAESDKHQDGARQPYRSREHSTESASQKQSKRSPSNEGDKEREPE
jgi:hypothetical protein